MSGGTDAAVRKALATGRIGLEPDGTIDPVKADRQWELATNANFQRDDAAIEQGLDKARATLASNERRPIPQSAVDAVNEGVQQNPGPDPMGEGTAITFAKARAAHEALKAQAAKLRLQRLKGDLVDRRAAVALVFDLARKERDSWHQLPARKAAMMAADLGVDAHTMEQALDRMIREHLAELGEIKIELAPSV